MRKGFTIKIIVRVEQVPDTAEIKINPVKDTSIRTGVPSILNPFDRSTVEAASQPKDTYGGGATVLSMGPSQTKVVLRKALSTGTDRAYLATDRVFKDSDTYATSYISSSAIRHLGPFDVVPGGKQAISGDTGQAAPSTVEYLGVTRLTCIASMKVQGDKVIARHQVEEGVEVIEAKLPAPCTATKETNKPCYAITGGKLESLKAETPELALEDMKDIIDTVKIGLEGSPTKVKATFTPKRAASRAYIADGPQSMAASFPNCLEESRVLQKGGKIMGFEQYKDVQVFIRYFEGTPKNMGLELLGQDRKLTEDLGQQLYAVVIGRGVENAVQVAGIYSTDKTYMVQGDEYSHYSTDGYGYAFLKLCRKYNPDTIPVGATVNGGDLGFKLAVNLHIGLTASCMTLNVGDTGSMTWKRLAFGGNLYAQIFCSETRLQMGTIRPGTFKKPASLTESRVGIIYEEVHANHIRTQVTQFMQVCTDGTIPMGEADVIVSGGYGVKNSEGFVILKELADLLDGMVGCSKAAVDSGWTPQLRQVGQTGSTATPKLYITCRISGAAQHVADMSESGTMVAVNKDVPVPMLEVADCCLVGDLFGIVPVLTKELKTRKRTWGSRWTERRQTKSRWGIT